MQSSPAANYTLFPREDVEIAINLATSGPAQDTYSPTSAVTASSRSGCNDCRGSQRPVTYHRDQGREDVDYTVGRGSFSSRPSAESPRVVPATLNRPRTTQLSRHSLEFTQLPYGDYACSKVFIANNPAILKDDPNDLVQEALHQEKEGRDSQAKVCVQQSALLRQCLKISPNGRRDFFSGLKRRDPKILNAFLDDFETAMNAVRMIAQTEAQNSIATEARRCRPNPSPRGSIDHLLSSGMHIMSLSAQRVQKQTYETRAGLERPNPADQYDPSRPLPRPGRLSLVPVKEDSMVSTVSTDSMVSTDSTVSTARKSSIEPDIRSTENDMESLDPRYVKRHDAKKFFVVGRVFAFLWHESAGEGYPGREGHIDQTTTEGRFGSRVFSHIRRMAVVKERHGYCVCIPIHTYGGQGLLKRGLDLRERQAHSIIQASNTKPAATKEEMKFLVKKSISVIMDNEEQQLDRFSRVNFATPQTVDWNVKVMKVGKVAPESIQAFESYWQQEPLE